MIVVKIRFVLNNKPGSDGLFLVMLYIFKSGTKSPAYIGTGVYVKKQHFNTDATREAQNWVKKSDLSGRHNAELSAIYDRAKEVIRFLTDSGRVDICSNNDIKQYIQTGDPADLIVYMSNLKEKKKKEGDFRKFAGVRTLLGALADYGRTSLPVGSITVQFLKDFKKHLLNGRQETTVKEYLSCLRACYNSYHAENEITPKFNPFTVFKLGNPKPKEKSVLYPSNIQNLVDEKELTDSEIHAKNVYLILYFLQGMRVGDLITLKRSSIVETYDLSTGEKLYKVDYQMSKSKKNRNLPVPPVANQLIEYYLGLIVDVRQNEPEGYFLPFMYTYGFSAKSVKPGGRKMNAKSLETPKGIFDRTALVDGWLNNNFKSLCKKMGLPSLTMHSSRHALATHLYEKTKDIRLVQKSMAHASIITTEKYLHDYTSSNLAGDVYDDYQKAK